MSTRTGFAIVGTAIGAYFGNASLGYAIGSMVGGYVDPVQVKGPRISDAQQQTSQDGVPIPITYGAVRISGNIIASGKLVEHRKVDDGKGSGTETTTYYYTRTYAIGICEGPIGAIRRIWRDGKLVFDESTDANNQFVNQASTRQFRSHSDIYLGDEDQTPNSALQALYGPENVPAHRGLAYVVIRDDDLTNRAGSIPSYEFEVVQRGSRSSDDEYAAKTYYQNKWFYPNPQGSKEIRNELSKYVYSFYSSGYVIPFTESLDDTFDAIDSHLGLSDAVWTQMGWTYDFNFLNVGNENSGIAPSASIDDPNGGDRVVMGMVYINTPFSVIEDEIDLTTYSINSVPDGGVFCYKIGSIPTKTGVIYKTPRGIANENTFPLIDGMAYFVASSTVAVKVLPSCELLPGPDWVQIPGTPGFYVDNAGNIHQVGECEEITGTFLQLQNQQLSSDGLHALKLPLGPLMLSSSEFNTEEVWTNAYIQAVASGDMEDGLVYLVDYPAVSAEGCLCAINSVYDPEYPLLSEIVADLCLRRGMTGDEIDVSQLTDEVKGFTVATATSAADAINALAPAYQFDAAEWDARVRFIKRGGATVAALNEDDAFDSDEGRIVETRAQELELPRRLTLGYMDPDANYAVTTQTAERLSVTVASRGTDQVQLAVVMDNDKSAQTADILLKDKWSSINGTLSLEVGDEFSTIVPTDVLFLSYEEALFRCRAVEVENSDGRVKLNLQQDIAGAYSSIAVGVPPRPAEEGQPNVLGPTFLEIMNLPALRDQDDLPGLYLAVCGPVGSWPGAQIAVSRDGGQTWRDVLRVTQQGTIGRLTSLLGNWSEHIPDTENQFSVELTFGELESVTEEQMYSGANPMCVGEEIVQFETQTLTEPKNYDLDGLLFRGRKNTSPAAWSPGTRFVDLTTSVFLPLDRSFIGQTVMLRATTLGTDVQYGTVRSYALSVPKSVQEWPVTNIVHSRAIDEALSLSWSPRHRMGTSRSPYPSIYFSGYRLVFTNGTITRTFDTAGQSFAYSAAAQTADFGSAGPLSVTIFSMNSIIGPGVGETVNV